MVCRIIDRPVRLLQMLLECLLVNGGEFAFWQDAALPALPMPCLDVMVYPDIRVKSHIAPGTGVQLDIFSLFLAMTGQVFLQFPLFLGSEVAPGKVALFPAFIVRCIDMGLQGGHVEGGVVTENATQGVLQVFAVDVVGHVATASGLMPTNQADALVTMPT